MLTEKIVKSPPDITSYDIANWFLSQSQERNHSLRHMKLQKLVYFAFGWYYTYFDAPLFHEKIYAWPLGPVVEDLACKYKIFNGGPIEADIAERPVFDEDVTWILEQVWKNFSHYSNRELSLETHRPGSPWDVIYESQNRDTEIPFEKIYHYFKGLLKKYENG